ncbi:pre-mRNA-splicing factor Cwc23p [Monosporozyma servazzii]
MSDILKEVVENKEDLYHILEFDHCIDTTFPLQSIKDDDIKKQYRLLALKYHPDKNVNNDNDIIAGRFHKISIASQILSNHTLRASYDHWYETFRQRQALIKHKNNKRKQLINDLDKNETTSKLQTQNNNNNTNMSRVDLYALQKNGEQLRKLKQFNLPYGNWDGKLSEPKEPKLDDLNGNKWVDSSSLAIEVKGSIPQGEDLIEILIDILQIRKQDIQGYLNVGDNEWTHGPHESLVNLMFSHPKIALKIMKKWREGRYNDSSKDQIIITKLTRKLDKQFFVGNSKFLDNKIDLNKDIEDLLIEPEVLGETILID